MPSVYRPNFAGPYCAGLDSVGSDCAGPYCAGLDSVGPDCAGPYCAGLDSVGPDCAGPDRTCTQCSTYTVCTLLLHNVPLNDLAIF